MGWVFRNGFRNKRAIVVRKELIANIRERFAHLITDVVQGDTRWNTPDTLSGRYQIGRGS